MRPITALSCLSLVLCHGANAQSVEERIAAVEAAIHPNIVIHGEEQAYPTLAERMEQLRVPGVSIAVVNGGAVEWAKGYGLADRELGRPVDTSTLFQAASISKPVAAMAALRYVQDGRLDLDANVNDSLTSWQLPDNEFTANRKVTLRGLLNHTAGTTVWGFPGYRRDMNIPATVGVLEGDGNTEAIRVWKEPGESWRYSGGGYTVMQLLLADVSGRTFPELMHEAVLEPLGMMNSTYEQPLPERWHTQAAAAHGPTGVKYLGNWHVYPEMAAAGLWTTPSDLARYILEVQRALRGESAVLSRETARAMLVPGMNNHGLGPTVTDDGLRFGHGGSNAGFRANLTAYIDGSAGAVIMTNSDTGDQLIQELLITIADVYGWAGIEPIEKTVVQLDPAAYASFVGTYKVANQPVEIAISYVDGRLTAVAPALGELVLMPESERLFFERSSGLPVEFFFEDDRVSHFIAGGNRADRIDTAQ